VTPYQYVYDALPRLTEVRNSATAALLEGYTYDPLGNRTTKTAGGSTVAYVYDAANQLKEILQGSATGVVLASLTYDANGNLTQKTEGSTTTALTYDALNRLSQVAGTGQPTQSYVYDHEGRRIQKTVGAAASFYLYSGPDIVAEYCDTWTAACALTTHGPNMDDPLLRARGSTAQYYHQDGLGSVVAVSNGTGGTDGTARYDAWGVRLSGTGVIPQYGYTGREPDGTGLIYYRGRYYDPALGRFTQRDPIGLAGGLNQYAYVGNNPINYTDPTGAVINIPVHIAGGLYGLFSGAVGGAITGLASGGATGAWQGALAGAGAGFVTGMVAPWLSGQAGEVAAAAIVGGASSVIGQVAGNVATQALAGKPLAPFQNFDVGAMMGATVGGAMAVGPGSIAAGRARVLAGIPLQAEGRITGTLVTPTAHAVGGVAGNVVDGLIVGGSEFLGSVGGKAITAPLTPPVSTRTPLGVVPTPSIGPGTQSLPALAAPDLTPGRLGYTSGGFASMPLRIK
jgi:RHS repeat-associated protein